MQREREYGGADPGYQTHGTFYLARHYELSGEKKLLDSIKRSLEFLKHFVHVDGSLGGEYTSRNTQTYYPAAFEMLASESETAAWIVKEMSKSVRCSRAAGPKSVDVYNIFPLLNNYVFAYRAAKKNAGKHKNGTQDFASFVSFEKAGICRKETTAYQAFIGTEKGGVIKVLDKSKRKVVLNDCGYLGRLSNGKQVSSQWVDEDLEAEVKEDKIFLRGRFFEISRPVFNPFSFLGFRIFSLTLGRISWFSYKLKTLLVKVLIYRKKELDLHFERTIFLKESSVEVEDKIYGNALQTMKLFWGDVFATIHMGSSKYFVPSELEPETLNFEQIELGDKSEVILNRKVEFTT